MPNTEIEELANLTEEERQYVMSILQEYQETGKLTKYESILFADYKEIPVDIETFICDNTYLGKAWHDGEGNLKLYPYWLAVLKDLFPDNITTSVNNFIESGARGLGKSEIAVTIGLYMMYRVMCLKNPWETLKIKPTEKVCFAFMNITKYLAEDIGVSKFQKTVQMSPWFMARGSMTQRDNSPYWLPPEPIDIIIGSQASHVIGQPIYFAFFDEVSFQRNQDIDKQKKMAIDMIDTAIGGMKTRFIVDGKNPTLLVLASSKRSEKSFLEQHMKKKLETDKENVKIVDEAVWTVKPKGVYSDKTFRVAVGNKFLQSVTIGDGEDSKPYEEKGYKILNVPIDFKPNFLEDIERALCDFAGISSSEISKYINGISVREVMTAPNSNPFVKEILEIGNAPDDRTQYYDFFDLSKVPEYVKYHPLFVHLDMSLSGDRTGIAGIWIKGKKVSNDEETQSNDLFFTTAFCVAIKAPKGRQISFEKNRNFIYWLKEQGFNIKGVSSDTFQSYDTGQTLLAKGYPYSVLSVDRIDTDHICKPYQYLKSTIYEKRIEMFECKLLRDELTDLERNINTGKVDHPDGGCFTDDTKIALVDGRNLSIKDLLLEQQYRTNYVYSFNEEKHIIEPKLIVSVHQTKLTKDLVKVVLDNGEEITCTPDHKFMLRDGSYEEIQNLSVGDSLMPLYTKVSSKGLSGYRMYYEPIEDKWHYEHRKFCGDTHLSKGMVVHHCNYDKLDNSPTNLKIMSIAEHTKLHNNSTHDYDKTSHTLKEYFSSIRGTDKEVERNQRCSSGTIASYKRRGMYRGDETATHIQEVEKLAHKPYEELTLYEKKVYGTQLARKQDPTIVKRISATLSQRHKEGKFKNAYTALSKLVWYTNGQDNLYLSKDTTPPDGYHRGRTLSQETREKLCKSRQNISLQEKERLRELYSKNTSSRIWITDGTVDKYIHKDDEIPMGFHRGRTKVGKNHKIVSIERITRPCRVYDLTIKDNHNFALSAGVFVHNSKDLADAVCGALYNASKNAEEFAYNYGESLETMLNVSNSGSYENDRKQITIDFEEALKQVHNPFNIPLDREPQRNQPQKTKQKQTTSLPFLDFGLGEETRQIKDAMNIADGIIVF